MFESTGIFQGCFFSLDYVFSICRRGLTDIFQPKLLFSKIYKIYLALSQGSNSGFSRLERLVCNTFVNSRSLESWIAIS